MSSIVRISGGRWQMPQPKTQAAPAAAGQWPLAKLTPDQRTQLDQARARYGAMGSQIDPRRRRPGPAASVLGAGKTALGQ